MANVYNIVTDFGAVAGQTCDDAFSKALVAMSSNKAPSVLYVPGDPLPYYVTQPIWITKSNITIKGDGREVSKITASPGCNTHVVVAAINTNVPGGIPSSDHFISLNQPYCDGTLDGCTGFNLKNDQIFSAWSSPLDQPISYLNLNHKNWSDFRQITISIIIDDGGKPLPAGPIYGIGEISPHGYQARPFHLIAWGGGGWLEFRFTTAENPSTYRSFIFAEGPPSGVKRISIQLDLVACSAIAWVNKTQVVSYPFVNMGPTSSQTRTLSFTPKDNLVLVGNAYHPFLVGGYGSCTQSRGGSGIMNIGVCGFAVSKGFLFANNGVGSPQKQPDGTLVTDSYMVRPPNYTLIGRLGIESISATNPLGGRQIPITIGHACAQGGGVAYGLLSPAEQNLNCKNWLSNFKIQDLSLTSKSWYGDLLSLGGLWNVEVDSMYYDYGFCNIGSVRMGPSTYKVKISNIQFGYSFGSSYLGHTHITHASDLEVFSGLKNFVTTVGTELNIDNVFLTSSPGEYTFALYAEEGGGNYNISNIEVDNEGNVTPNIAAVFVEVPFVERASLTINRYTTGSIGPRAAFLHLKKADNIPTGHYPVSISNVFTDQCGVMIRTDHPDVAGEIIADSPNKDYYPWLECVGGITTTNLVVRSRRYSIPPSDLIYTDTAIIDSIHPVLGLPSKYRCIRGGTYGSSIIPAWRGESIQDDGTGSNLGAFSTNSECITAKVSGISSSGGLYTQYARNTMLNYWLKGVAAIPPKKLKLQLSLYTYNPVDINRAGYSTALVTGMFSSSVDRSTSNTSPITFSLVSGFDLDIQSVVLYAPNDYNPNDQKIIWQSRLSKALLNPQAGPALTIATGDIIVSNGSASGTPIGNQIDEYTGGFTNDILNSENDFWHNGKPLPTITNRYLGLSTGFANREGIVTEPTDNGYQRVVLTPTDFYTADGGRSVLKTDKTFSNATNADWPVNSVFIASDDKIIWMANLITPRTARSGGPPLKFVAKSLIVAK